MCTSSPNIPPPPPPPQEVKAPTASLLKRRDTASQVAGGSLLTGPSGVARNALVTGAPTLLGGVARG